MFCKVCISYFVIPITMGCCQQAADNSNDSCEHTESAGALRGPPWWKRVRLAHGLRRRWWSSGTPTWGRGPRRCPDGSGPTRGAPSARAPGSILSLRGNAAEAGDATGRYGCHGVGRELRNEGLVDPRMVTIPRVE